MPPDAFERLLMRLLAAIPPGRAIDLGAGAGLVTLACVAAGHRVRAYDVDRATLARLAATARRSGLPIRTQPLDLARRLPAARFDVAVFVRVSHQLPGHRGRAVIATVRDRTPAGGVNVLATMTRRGDLGLAAE